MERWNRFNRQPVLPLGEDGRRITGSKEHIAVSRRAAAEGMVLLKNEGNVLPLKRGARVALFGKAGADYVAPYVNRIDNMGFDGTETVKKMQMILGLHHYETKILAASFKNSQQVLDLCAYGIRAVTCAPAVIDGFVKNAAIDAAVRDFQNDFRKSAPQGNSMADLIG